jgi:predicted ABC-type ATPase
MRIHRIRLRNYRGIDQHEIAFPAAGVTVVEGENEVGKSSIAEALDLLFDFQDSSTNKAVKATKPVHKDVGTEVEADIEAGPYRFTYTKRFHKEKATTLTVVCGARRENLTGREAHERARQIMAEAVDVPLWKALRLQQGVRPDQADLSEQTSLAAALDAASAGSLAGERESTLVERARAEFEKYWTPSGKVLKADVLALARGEGEAEARVHDVRRRLADVDDDVDHAASLVTRIAELIDEVEEQRARVRGYEGQWQRVDRLLQEVDTKRAVAKAAAIEEQAAREEATRRAGLVEQVEQADRRHRELLAAHRRHSPVVDAAVAAVANAEEAWHAAADQARAVERYARDRQNDLQFQNDLLHLEMLTERWLRVQEAEARLAQLDALLDADRVDDHVLARVEEAHLAAVQCRARVEGESAVVSVEALRAVSVDGTPLAAGAVYTSPVGSAAVVVLDGIARITVRGSREASQSAVVLADAEERLAEALAPAGVADVAEARHAAAVRREARAARDHLSARLQEDLRDLTPDRMAKKIERLEARVAEARAGREAAATDSFDLDVARRLAEEAEAAVAAAQDRVREAEQTVALRRHELESVRGRAEASAHELEVAHRQLVALRGELEAARARTPDGVLAGQLEEAARRGREAAGALDRAATDADKARPEELRATLDNAGKVLEKLEAERRGAERTQAEVQTRLAVWGEEGLHDRLAEAEAELEHLRRARRSTERRAAAARRLYETLLRCRAEARQAYVAPLQAKIEAFGRIVFDQSFAVELGDDLRIVRRTLRGVTVAFDQLSTGTREQLCVISRLACAALVARDGGVPVILDDALGWSDPRRLQRLGAVLALAASEAQVIVLTCMPDRYRHVGSAHTIHLT